LFDIELRFLAVPACS